MATSVSKLQEKLELKRQRKLEKKLAKQQRDPVDSESPKATVEAVADNPQKPEKKAKVRSLRNEMMASLKPLIFIYVETKTGATVDCA